jgi:hypothetical protein
MQSNQEQAQRKLNGVTGLSLSSHGAGVTAASFKKQLHVCGTASIQHSRAPIYACTCCVSDISCPPILTGTVSPASLNACTTMSHSCSRRPPEPSSRTCTATAAHSEWVLTCCTVGHASSNVALHIPLLSPLQGPDREGNTAGRCKCSYAVNCRKRKLCNVPACSWAVLLQWLSP